MCDYCTPFHVRALRRPLTLTELSSSTPSTFPGAKSISASSSLALLLAYFVRPSADADPCRDVILSRQVRHLFEASSHPHKHPQTRARLRPRMQSIFYISGVMSVATASDLWVHAVLPKKKDRKGLQARRGTVDTLLRIQTSSG